MSPTDEMTEGCRREIVAHLAARGATLATSGLEYVAGIGPAPGGAPTTLRQGIDLLLADGEPFQLCGRDLAFWSPSGRLVATARADAAGAYRVEVFGPEAPDTTRRSL